MNAINDEEQRQQIIKKIEGHILEIRRLAAQLELPDEEMQRVERGFGALSPRTRTVAIIG